MDFICKLSIGLAVTWLFYWLLLRRLTFYRWNRLFLLVYPAVAYLVPFIDITDLLPQPGEDKAWFQAIPVLSQYSFRLNSQGIAWTSAAVIGLLVMATGSVFMTLRFCWQYWSLRKTVSGAVLLADDDARLYHVDKQIVPFSFGRSIYLNKNLHTEAELQEILRHEFIHVKQRHSLDMLWGELLCILNWYNPFAWLLRKAIRQNLEFIADHQVLANGVDRKQYQYLLLKVTGIATFSAANNFNLSSLKKRIIMMNKKTSASVHLLRFVLVVPVLAVLLLAFRSVTHTDFPSPSNLLADQMLTDTVKNPDQFVTVTQGGDTYRTATRTIAIDTVPVTRKSSQKDKDGSISIHQKNNIVTVRKNKGAVEKFDLNDPKQKEDFEKKYGELKPPPPPPPLPPARLSISAPPAPPAPPAGVNPVPAPPAPPAPPKSKNEVVVVGYGIKRTEKLALKYAGTTAEEVKTVSGVATTAGETVVTNHSPVAKVNVIAVEGQTEPLFVIDGKLTPGATLKTLTPDKIVSITVLKGTNAIKHYGSQGTNGVVEVITKDAAAPANATVPVNLSDNLCDLDALIIIDGKKVDCKEATAYIKKNKDRIASINVLKGTENVKKGTGQEAKNAIVIKTKAD